MKIRKVFTCLVLLWLFTVPARAGEYEVDKNTVLLLHFNGNTCDVRGFFEGIPLGSKVRFAEGKFGTKGVSISDDGVVKYDVPKNFNMETGMIELWIKPDWDGVDGKSHTFIHAKGPGEWNCSYLTLYKNQNYQVRFCISDKRAKEYFIDAQITIFKKDIWVHLAVMWDNTVPGLKFYVNGELKQAKTFEESWDIEPFSVIWVGNCHENGGRCTDGTIDELRISKTVRMKSE